MALEQRKRMLASLKYAFKIAHTLSIKLGCRSAQNKLFSSQPHQPPFFHGSIGESLRKQKEASQDLADHVHHLFQLIIAQGARFKQNRVTLLLSDDLDYYRDSLTELNEQGFSFKRLYIETGAMGIEEKWPQFILEKCTDLRCSQYLYMADKFAEAIVLQLPSLRKLIFKHSSGGYMSYETKVCLPQLELLENPEPFLFS